MNCREVFPRGLALRNAEQRKSDSHARRQEPPPYRAFILRYHLQD